MVIQKIFAQNGNIKSEDIILTLNKLASSGKDKKIIFCWITLNFNVQRNQ